MWLWVIPLLKTRVMKNIMFLVLLAWSTLTLRAQDRSQALKYDFFTPVAGCFGFSYEAPRNDFISFDYDAGFIGVQLGDYFERDQFAGAYAAFGPRLYFKKDASQFNNLRGLYFKPQLMVNFFSFTDSVEYYDWMTGFYENFEASGTDLTINLLATMGTQWVLSDIVVFDLWFGLGYGGGWINDEVSAPEDAAYYGYDPNSFFKYSFVRFGDSPLIFDGGLSIGFRW